MEKTKLVVGKWQVIVTYALVIGLILLIVYVGKTQIYRSRAELNVAQTFTVTAPNNQPVTCSSNNICTTEAEEVTVQFNPTDQNIQDLLNSIP